MADFDTNIVADDKAPNYVVELDGDVVAPLDDTAGWVALGDALVVSLFANAKRSLAFSLQVIGLGAATLLGLTTLALPAYDATKGIYWRLFVFISDLTGVTTLTILQGSSPLNFRRWTIDVVAAGLKDATDLDSAGWNHVRLTTLSPQPTGYTLAVVGVPFDVSTDTVEVTIDKPMAATTELRISALTVNPWRYSTGKIVGPRAPTKFGWLRDPKVGMNTTTAKDGTLTGAAASFTVVDDGGDGMPWNNPFGNPWSSAKVVIEDIQKFGFDGRQATFSMGFLDAIEVENDATYKPIFRGFVDDIKHLGRAWSFPVSDNLRLQRVPFARNATSGTPLIVSGKVHEVLLTIALSTGTGANHPVFDTLAAGDGAGIPADLFDIIEIIAELVEFAPLDDVSFEFHEQENSFLGWVFKEVCLPHGIVPKLTADGRVSFTVVRPAFPLLATTVEVDSSNVIVATALPGFRQNREDIYNSIFMQFDYDTATDTFQQDATFTDPESIARYGENQLPIQSKGIKTPFVAERAGDRIIERLGDGNPPIDALTHMSLQPLEIGQLVKVTLEDIVPDLEVGSYSLVGAFCEVDGKGLDPSIAANRLRLGVTSFRQERFAVINDVLTDFPASTPEEQAFGAFISGLPLDADGDFTVAAGVKGWLIAPG